MKVHGVIAYVLIALILLSISLANGNMGYNVAASVGGASWSIDRYTKNLSYDLNGTIYGAGNFSRYNYVKPISDLAYIEKSSAVRGGNLSLNEIVGFRSLEGTVSASYVMQSAINKDDQNSTNIESANVSISDAWPFYFTNQRMLLYAGRGIKTFEKYESSGDIISTYSNSWRLKKDSLFLSSNNKTKISIQLNPQGIIRERHSNKKMTYLLDVQSLGNMESLDIIRTEPSDERTSKAVEDNITRISQEYAGQVSMKLKIESKDTLPLLPDNESYNQSEYYLPCCSNDFVLDPQMMKFMGPCGSTNACQSITSANKSEIKLIDHAMASDVQGSTERVVERTDLFYTSNNKVYSWLCLGPIDGAHKVEWKWFSPDGNLMNTSAKMISNSQNLSNDSITIYSLFSPASYINENTIENWLVDIFLDDRKILTEHFALIHDIARIPVSFNLT